MHCGDSFIQLISHKFLHLIDMTQWLLPFASRTEMEVVDARKSATPSVLKATFTSFEKEVKRNTRGPRHAANSRVRGAHTS
jgi:hypothetical protein